MADCDPMHLANFYPERIEIFVYRIDLLYKAAYILLLNSKTVFMPRIWSLFCSEFFRLFLLIFRLKVILWVHLSPPS